MIPIHLQGKSAEQIISKMNDRFYNEVTTLTGDDAIMDYGKYVEDLLLLAVKDALCNCDTPLRVNELMAGVDGPGNRSIVFLNMILPCKEIK